MAWKRKPKSTESTSSRSRRRGLSLRRLLVRVVGSVALVFVLGPALFVWINCYTGSKPPAPSPLPKEAEGVAGYARGEALTYLTLPEWFIVYNADEYAAFVARRPPSGFPYLGSVRQYWGYYSAACSATRRAYPFDSGYHVMLGTIGASFTLENILRFGYENTVGRVSEWAGSTDTPEDAFARRVAVDYGTFMHTVPWYEFPFGSRLAGLWRETPMRGPHLIRKLERRFALSMEYGGKAVYGWVIRMASGAAYAPENLRIHARIEAASPKLFADERVHQVKALGPGSYIITLPRYEAFTRTSLDMLGQGVRFLDIAGNRDILITVIGRRGMSLEVPQGELLTIAAMLTDPTMQRLAIRVPVSKLTEVVSYVAREHAVVEHLYDY
jgi:hypothetical protein